MEGEWEGGGWGGGRGGREAHTGEEATYMKFLRFFNLENKAIFFKNRQIRIYLN